MRFKNTTRIEVLVTGIIYLLITTFIFVPISLKRGYSLTSAAIIGIVLGFSGILLTAKILYVAGNSGLLTGGVTIGILVLQDMVAIAFPGLTSGRVSDPCGQIKAGFEVTGIINRKEIGLTWDAVTEAGNVVVGDKIKLQMNLQFVET